MMLDIIEERNPELVRIAVELHQKGDIAPNTYLVDLDAVRENTRKVKMCGDRYGIKQYVMTKQNKALIPPSSVLIVIEDQNGAPGDLSFFQRRGGLVDLID